MSKQVIDFQAQKSMPPDDLVLTEHVQYRKVWLISACAYFVSGKKLCAYYMYALIIHVCVYYAYM